ncbi:MAG: rhodanese-like domain-containing protein [Gammaproteobacteria bacterium]|nr:rhodanese-like domain-containing protein [Gammaproteobacteria bacterium]MCW8923806.1 rhodanese-like domain-containing protein [Gammaproteobacteria bacterium]
MAVELQTILPKAAWQLCQENSRALLIDVRSSMEYLFVGHAVGSIHIPWIDEPDWVVNPHFTTDVRKLILGGMSEDNNGVPIILICRSGKRSKEAGMKLIEDGFSNVFNVEEGFEGELDEQHHRSTSGGWRFHDLPWEQC